MAYQEVPTDGGLYMIDRVLVERIIYDSAYLKSQAKAKLRTSDEGFGVPSTHYYEIDYDRARTIGSAAVSNERGVIRAMLGGEQKKYGGNPMAARQVEAARSWLTDVEKEGIEARKTLLALMQQACRQTQRNVESRVGKLEHALWISKALRDASAEAMVILAAPVMFGPGLAAYAAAEGGALFFGGMGLAAAGGVLKGVGKWEDSGDFGAGVVKGSMSFILAILPGGSGLGQKIAVVITKAAVEAASDTGIGLLEGKGLSEAAAGGTIDAALGAAFEFLPGAKVAGDKLEDMLKVLSLRNVVFPARVALRTVGAGAASEVASGGISDALSEKLFRTVRANKAPAKTKQISRRLLLAQPIMADLAILGPDMSTPARTW